MLSGYNILGDGTASALAPMLAGRLKNEMVHEMNRLETKHVDDVLDFVWRRFENQGYVTQYGEYGFQKYKPFITILEDTANNSFIISCDPLA